MKETKLIRLLGDFSGKDSSPTTDTEEVHEGKVVIQATRIVHWKRHENDWIWTTSVQSPVIQDLNSDRVLYDVIRILVPLGDFYLVYSCLL